MSFVGIFQKRERERVEFALHCAVTESGKNFRHKLFFSAVQFYGKGRLRGIFYKEIKVACSGIPRLFLCARFLIKAIRLPRRCCRTEKERKFINFPTFFIFLHSFSAVIFFLSSFFVFLINFPLHNFHNFLPPPRHSSSLCNVFAEIDRGGDGGGKFALKCDI